MKTYLIPAAVALVVSLLVVWQSSMIRPEQTFLRYRGVDSVQKVLYTLNGAEEIVPLDFTVVVEKVVNSVVHITSFQTAVDPERPQDEYSELPDPFREFFEEDMLERFFGPRGQPNSSQQRGPRGATAAGSGVLVNENGYIVTNNHVVDNADAIEVTLYDNRSYEAKVIGTDPSTDLALIQIKQKNLPFLSMTNSDKIKVGEWVLAVGNPYNLNSTVTAGIVSAKSRNINILRDQYAVESFIQTDAAINPGNSGGALVDLEGSLVGINTAIASPTGSYAGYGFAVPSNIVSKVIEDLLKYGVVQYGYLGLTIRGVDGNLRREKDLEVGSGVYVDSLSSNSAAAAAGIKSGDVITEVNGVKVVTAPELQEIISRHRPGDKLHVKVNRKGDLKEFVVTLRNRNGKVAIIPKSEKNILNTLGVELETLSQSAARKLGIEGGVKVTKLYVGKIMKHTDMREGFIITKVDGKPVTAVADLTAILQNKKGGVLFEGVYEDIPGDYYYAIGL